MPRLLDLYCGRGGWTVPALAAGWECIGVDIQDFGYPGTLIKATLPKPPSWIMAFEPDLVVASPPCEEYARHHLPWIKGPPPDRTHLAASLVLADQLPVPVVVECSRFAALYFPGSVACGPYRLWGQVPALLPHCPPSKMKYSGRDPSRRAMINPLLSEWIIHFFQERFMRCPVCKKDHPGEPSTPGTLSATHRKCVEKQLRNEPVTREDPKPAGDEEDPKPTKKKPVKA